MTDRFENLLYDLSKRILQLEERLVIAEKLPYTQPSDSEQKGIAKRIVVNGETFYISADGQAILKSLLAKQETLSGAAAGAYYDDLVIDGNSNAGISILTAINGAGGLLFGDSGDNDVGGLIYNHNLDALMIRTGGLYKMFLFAEGAVVTSAFRAEANAPLEVLDDPAGGSPWVGQVLVCPSSNSKEGAITIVSKRNSGESYAPYKWSIIAGSSASAFLDAFRIYNSEENFDALNIGTEGVVTTALQSALSVNRNSSAQSIPSATITKVEFNNVIYDTQGEYDETTNYRFTAKYAGKYHVHASVFFDNNYSVGVYGVLYIYIDGVLAKILDTFDASATGGQFYIRLKGGATVHLDANSYIEIKVYQGNNEGASWDLRYASDPGDYINYLTIDKIA